jgi:hypothetical protein
MASIPSLALPSLEQADYTDTGSDSGIMDILSDPEDIFELIEKRKWEEVVYFVQDVPKASTVCFYRSGSSAFPDGTLGNLALHECCKHQPPIEVIVELLKSNEDAAMSPGHCGYLPLHFACSSKASVEVVGLLIEVHPASTRIREELDDALPIHLAAKWGASEDVLMEILTTYPEGSFMRDVYGKTPMDHAKNLPSPDVRDSVMNTLNAAPILVEAAKSATLRISHEHESRTRGLNEAHAEYVRQLEARHNEEKITFMQLELKFQTELAEEKERNILFAEILMELEVKEAKAKKESDKAQAILATERNDFRSKLESQERAMKTVMDEAIGKVKHFEKKMSDQQSFVEKLEEKAKECDENRAKLATTNNSLKAKDNTLIHLNQLLSTKEHLIRELHQQLEEKKAAERVSSKQAEFLSTLQSGAQHELDTTRIEKQQLRNQAELLQEQLFEANRKFNTQEHRLGSIKSLVSSLSYSLQTWDVDDEWEKNLDTHSAVVEGMEAARQHTTRTPRRQQSPKAIGTSIPKTIGTTKLSSLTIGTIMSGEMGLSHFGSGKSAEETATTFQEDEDNYTLGSTPSPARTAPAGLNHHKQHRLA